jgi:hypothetical protein
MDTKCLVKIVGAFIAGTALTTAAMWTFLENRTFSREQQKMFVTFVLQNSADWRRAQQLGAVSQNEKNRDKILSAEDQNFNPDLLYITQSSELIAFKQSSGVLLIVYPENINGATTWRCKGFPVSSIPASCR